MERLFIGVLYTSYHGLGASFYDLFSIGTRFEFNKWNRWQIGSLSAVSVLSIIRPWIQKPVDQQLGEKYSGLLFDLTPFLAVGWSAWRATKDKREAFLTGAYFGVTHKITNVMQLSVARQSVWDEFRGTQHRAPRDYYEALELKRAQADFERRETQRHTKEAMRTRALLWVQTGTHMQEGTKTYKASLRSFEFYSAYTDLLKAQVDAYTHKGENDQALKAIGDMGKDIGTLSRGVRYRCYAAMIDAYQQLNQTGKLRELLEKMEQELPEIEKEEEMCSARHPDWGGYGYGERINIAKGYIYLQDQAKVTELMKTFPWESFKNYDSFKYRSPFVELFTAYNKTAYGEGGYGEDFFASWGLEGTVLKNAQQEFYFQAALKAIENDDDANAWINKITDAKDLPRIIRALAKKDLLDAAEALAKGANDGKVYRELARKRLEADQYDQAIALAEKVQNNAFMAEIAIAVHQKDRSQEAALRELLAQPTLPLLWQVRVAHILGEETAPYIAKDPFVGHYALFEMTKDKKQLQDASANREKNNEFYAKLIGEEYLRLGNVDSALAEVQTCRLRTLIEFVAQGMGEGLISPEKDFTTGLSRAAALSCRVDVAKRLQKDGHYQEALTLLNRSLN